MISRKDLSNIPGWRTPRKIVVIESDDWGSIRMPSKEIYRRLERAGLDLNSGDTSRYNRFDNLARSHDLSCLFDVLMSVKGRNGKPAIFTAVSLVANPDFTRIREADFEQYFYEPITETLARTPGCEKSFELWTEGRRIGVFSPQFHGREHLNVDGWLKALRNGNQEVKKAFDYGVWGFTPSGEFSLPISLQAAFDLETRDEIVNHERIIRNGLDLFEKLHGFRATFFVPPNGPFTSDLEKVAASQGIRYMSTSKLHRDPGKSGFWRSKFRWLGKKNVYGQRYMTRNCFFEPSSPGRDWVDTCLKEVANAFRWCKPAVISTHRVNYVGALEAENRDNGLAKLKMLLDSIVGNWPEVEFISSEHLGRMINHENCDATSKD